MPPTSSSEPIFISYRRTDSGDAVGRICDHLTDHFGKGKVFLDQDSIDYGTDFAKRIKPAVENCKVMLVVIGSSWLTVKDGWKRRIDNPGDWVRQEVELALKNQVYVIPVFLNGAVIPGRGELPQPIQGLLGANACRLTTQENTRMFKAGMEGIIEALEKKVPALKPAPPITLEQFKFKVATISISEATEEIKTSLLGLKTEKVTRKVVNPEKTEGTAKQHTEELGSGVSLDMVYLPGGSFIMGASASEEGSGDRERPQHKVTVQPFLMGKYPITQAQWKAVAGLPKMEIELDLDPSGFKGSNRPVEQVFWHDAVEFCRRLSKLTGQTYRLPTEAEWEYACRAGTTTPFHFGETITPDLANYNGTSVYGSGVQGVYREETTPVGSFGVANAFGLYDMHGNVFEWCEDHEYVNYNGAPPDGSAWLDPKAERDAIRILRSASWNSNPRDCRSAYRTYCPPNRRRYSTIGFRAVCVAPRIL